MTATARCEGMSGLSPWKAGMLVLLLLHPLVSNAEEPSLSRPTVLVTDVKGQAQRLSSSHFKYSRMHRTSDLVYGYLEILRDKNFRATSWVHLSQVKAVTFGTPADQASIVVTLDSNDSIAGTFPDRDLVISGKGELGETEYKLADVRTVEVLQFETGNGGGPLVARAPASVLWKNTRKTRERWSVEDGGRAAVTTTGVSMRDAYNDRTVRSFGLGGDTVRSGYPSTRIRVTRGTSKTDVDLLECCSQVEITGATIDGAPEVRLTKKDGTMLPAAWLLVAQYGQEQPSDFESDDMLLWQTSYGYDGVALAPRRRIVVRKVAAP